MQLILPDLKEYAVLDERVKSLLIPSEIIINTTINKPQLEDGEHFIEGQKEISIYLDKLESFTKQWYACRCDMFP
ncbi:hypothetical protein [Leeuwenhoekiella sp. W20_SRS_FM14]|uniref:hypothetical protein n=1 Tax=Leeuwenhoekiella sp. W20_SRS_FM14 TaxID=3240270 RepID=UPI003F9CFDA0